MIVSSYSDFEGKVGKTIKVSGTLTEEIWQHFTILVETHPFMNYFNLEDGYQIVIYTKESISSQGELELIGKLIKAEYQRVNPRSKINEEYFEYQVLVDTWRRL
jgi:hypothetical protein